MDNVVENISNRDLCIGCGVCAGICPSGNLQMRFNSNGQYEVFAAGECLPKCGLCLTVCPRTRESQATSLLNQSEVSKTDGMKFTSETGFYRACFEGFSKGVHREKGASGGLATWLLEYLMVRGKVEGVVCVKQNNDPEKLFAYFIARNIEELRNAGSSAYYPVELSRCIKDIISSQGQYAVVGVPCFLTALTLAQKQFPKLRRRIIYKIGLVCSRLPDKNYVNHFARYFGIDSNEIRAVRFRDKTIYPARMRGIAITDKNGTVHRGNHRIDLIWGSGLVTPTACMFCDDVFAETSDVTFMDAWLPEHINEHYGRSLVLVRSAEIYEVFEKAVDSKSVSLEKTGVNRLIRAQKGRLFSKREQLKYRLKLANKWGIPHPEVRSFDVNELSLRDKLKTVITFYRQQNSRGTVLPMTKRIIPSILVFWDDIYTFARKTYGKIRFLLGR